MGDSREVDVLEDVIKDIRLCWLHLPHASPAAGESRHLSDPGEGARLMLASIASSPVNADLTETRIVQHWARRFVGVIRQKRCLLLVTEHPSEVRRRTGAALPQGDMVLESII